ncbi:MAG TPA: ERF family protein [Beijerinckiaceae bacterium]|nr:ERF family protein [Beijerinckiaceae bacterium]
MPASSDSIAKLATALAKAQVELVNPQKTLTATLERGRGGTPSSNDARACGRCFGPGTAQAYRYAPLSAGLDIVRKVLGRHEIAVVQITEVDRDRALVLLTTMLAHASGEWISARWPVCRTSDIAHPKIMGAALTYARRYGLFTLVGLAGEDDLDAPELTESGPEVGAEAARPSPPLSSEGPARRCGGVPESTRERALAPQGEPRSVAPGPDPGPTTAAEGDASGPEPAGAATFQESSGAPAMIGPEPSPEAPPRSDGRARRPRRADRRQKDSTMAPAPILAETERSPVGRDLGDLPSADPLVRDLAGISDTDGLFRLALAALPARNRMDEAERAAFDRAFRARAVAVGAEPDLLIAFDGHEAARVGARKPDAPTGSAAASAAGAAP